MPPIPPNPEKPESGNASPRTNHHERPGPTATGKPEAAGEPWSKEVLFDNLLSAIPDRIYFKDRQSRFMQINECMVTRFGLRDASEAVGKSDFDFFTEQHARQAFDDEQRIMSTGIPLIGFDEKETWPDGRITWCSSTKVPLRDAEGTVTGIVGISRDVTERRILDAQFLQSQKMDAFGQLAGGVAHDFNNILAAMLLQVSFIKLSTQLPKAVAAQMNDLEELTTRAGGLTRQLLMFSRRQDLEMRLMDLNAALEGTCSVLKRLIGEHITFELKLSPSPLWIEADAGMLEQVVMNLCINARDAMPNGGHLLIETRVDPADSSPDRHGSHACLVVTDTGCGMDPATKARIFEPFFTTKPVGKGPGLGLATVYGILQQHHGSVEVDSAPGLGSTFRIYFPLREQAPKPEPRKDPSILNGGTESVLLVEDEEMVREALAVCLRRAGYRVTEASHGAAAIRLWGEQKREFDILLTDFLMPGGMNGAQLAEQLLGEKTSLKVIIISGYAALPDGQAIVWPKNAIRLSKPFEMRKLLETVRRSLDTVQGAVAVA
jgi:two-component system, cell cycle sensor histidine kinase and response regulator CckA